MTCSFQSGPPRRPKTPDCIHLVRLAGSELLGLTPHFEAFFGLFVGWRIPFRACVAAAILTLKRPRNRAGAPLGEGGSV